MKTEKTIYTLVDLVRYSKDDRVRGTAFQAVSQGGAGQRKGEMAASSGQSYIEGCEEADDIIHLKNKGS